MPNPPEGYREKLLSFVQSSREQIAAVVAEIRSTGHRPEDAVFVVTAPDADSQTVVKTFFRLGSEFNLAPVFAVERQSLVQNAAPVYRTGDPKTLAMLAAAIPGKITVWAVVDGWPCCLQMDVVRPGAVAQA